MPKKENILRKFAFGGDLGCCVAQMGCVEISRVQRSSVGFSVAQLGASELSECELAHRGVLCSSAGCTLAQQGALQLKGRYIKNIFIILILLRL
jgi:hypothetical protein